MRTKPNRPKKKNWKNAIKPTSVASEQSSAIDSARPYWVKSYNLDGSGYWLFRAPLREQVLMKFQESVDSKKFKLVKMGFDRAGKSTELDVWKR